MTEEQQTMAEEQAVAEPIQNNEAAHTNQEQEVSDQDQNWKAAREQLASLKQENDRLNQAVQQLYSVQQAPKQQEDTGSDDDLLTRAEMKRMLQEKEAQIGATLNELRIQNQYRDFNDVVNKDNLSEITNNYPGLGEAIMSSKDPNLIAYVIGKNSERYRSKSQSQQQNADAKKIIANSQKPGASATASSGGGALSKADFFMNMSDEDFEKEVSRVKRSKDWTY